MQNTSEKLPALKRKNLNQINKMYPSEKEIVSAAIQNPSWGYRILKANIPGSPSETSIKNILKKYDLSTIEGRVVANHVVNKVPVKGIIKHPSPYCKYDKNLTTSIILPENIQRHHINRILGQTTFTEQNSRIVLYPGCIWYLICRNISKYINSKIDIYEFIAFDHFSNFIGEYQLVPVMSVDDFDQTFIDFYTDCYSQLLNLSENMQLVIVDFEENLTSSSKIHTIAKKYKIRPLIRRLFLNLEEDSFRVFHSLKTSKNISFCHSLSCFLNHITDDIYLRWINWNPIIDKVSSPSLKKLVQEFECYISKYNSNPHYSKFCYGWSPKKTFEDGVWLIPE